jgi:hypothetical protein
VPQLIENYRQSSADGISITFLLVWMAGDITNLAGALWADLVPTVIALAIYFCFADAVLLSQCFYYNTLNARRERKRSIAAAENAAVDENAPLLADQQENLGLPGSRRRSSAASRRRTRSTTERSNSLSNILEEGQGSTAWMKNTLSVAIILIAGAAGWAIAWRAGAWKPTPVDVSDGGRHMPVGAEVLGYASAVCYLGYVYSHHATRFCANMVQALVFLRSSRTTVNGLAKACRYCSSCFRLWETLPTVQGYVHQPILPALLLLTLLDPAPLC